MEEPSLSRTIHIGRPDVMDDEMFASGDLQKFEGVHFAKTVWITPLSLQQVSQERHLSLE